MSTLLGGCHCGAVKVAYDTAVEPARVSPRACDCSFCRKHGAAWTSDFAGRLAIGANAGALRAYRQGTNTADFLLCEHCGVLVAVMYEHAGGRHAAVNATCLDAAADFALTQCASPQRLDKDEKVERWLRLWVPNVRIDTR